MVFEASAPSNIALIKYMGKSPLGGNRPANPSLSLTLNHLRSFVTIEAIDATTDVWEPLSGFPELKLSEGGRKKFLSHFYQLKRHWNLGGHHRVRSANDFPPDCGLASSASSFAALTLATYEMAKSLNPNLKCPPVELSSLSRQGSGSSCRSFFSPWAEWGDEGAEAWDLDLQLAHAVVVVDDRKKSVSSSEAHQKISSSLLWQGRPERAKSRLEDLKKSLATSDWRSSYEICWAEFWDMHALFETSRPAFGYMSKGTLEVLDKCRQIWLHENDGPLVTMDAGANVHLLLREEQISQAASWLAGWNYLKSWN